MMFEFGEYGFIKWKFNFSNKVKIRKSVFSIGRNFDSIDQNSKKNNPGVSRWFDRYSILVQSNEKSIRSIERTSRSIKTRKLNFLQNFSCDCSEKLKRFQVLWMVLWNILTLHTCLLMKYNPMDINRGLC